MGISITPVEELRAEIQRLQVKNALLESELKQHFSGPKSLFNTLISSLRPVRPAGNTPAGAPFDIWGRLSKILLPLTIDKTLVGRSNLITRSLAGLISQNAAQHINQSSVTGIWDKLKAIMPGKGHQVGKRNYND